MYNLTVASAMQSLTDGGIFLSVMESWKQARWNLRKKMAQLCCLK